MLNTFYLDDYWNVSMRKPGQTKQLEGRLMINEPMRRHTSWRVGGPADRLYIPHDLDDLKRFLQKLEENEPLTWIGLGSNLLVRDGGIRGTVIATKNMDDTITSLQGYEITASAGITCAQLAKTSVKYGLTGAEFLVGIPGTFGGALAMNAGAFGGEIWEIISSVTTISRKGLERIRDRSEFSVGYRTVGIPEGEWFVSAILKLKSDPQNKGKTVLRNLLSRRSKLQPIGEPSCGSVFKNPDEGEPAAKMIDQCGLKGMTIGDAVVSNKHANFIVNKGKATARDMESLIIEIQKIVFDKFGIRLIPDVKIIGADLPEGGIPNA
jgi:UDP-N-acetylmuramate dehydrogenase